MARDDFSIRGPEYIDKELTELFAEDAHISDEPCTKLSPEEELGELYRFERFQENRYCWDGFDPPDYKIIPLTQGYFAVVSPEDYKRVAKHKWCVHERRDPNTGQLYKVYACRSRTVREKKRGAPTVIYLHRFLCGIEYSGHTKVVDHRNGDSLDCRRCNLLITDQAGNMGNRSFITRPVNGDTRRGVKPVKHKDKAGKVRITSYKGRIGARGKELYSKATFSCPERAHRWYVRMHRVLYPSASSWRDLGDVPPLIFPKTWQEMPAYDVPF